MRILFDAAVTVPAAVPPAPAPAPAAPAPAPAAAAPAPAGDKAPWAAPDPKPAADPAKPAEGVKAPEKISLTVPKDAEIEPAVVEKFQADASALGLTNDQAQKLFDLSLAEQKAQQAAIDAEMKARNQGWLEEARKRPDFKELSENAKRAYDFADPDGSFRKKLEESGLSNHIGLTEFVAKFGATMREDSLHANGTSVPKEEKPVLERMKERYEGAK